MSENCLLCQKSLCFVPNLLLMNITYEITIRDKYLKTSLRLFFHVATNNSALFSLREGTHYQGFSTSYFARE